MSGHIDRIVQRLVEQQLNKVVGQRKGYIMDMMVITFILLKNNSM